MSDIVRTTRRGKVLEIVFDRPPVNAINRAASRALYGAFAELRDDPDLIIGIGTRYSDFTTASKTQFQQPDVRFVNINVAEFDAHKHSAIPVTGDAKVTLNELSLTDVFNTRITQEHWQSDEELARKERLNNLFFQAVEQVQSEEEPELEVVLEPELETVQCLEQGVQQDVQQNIEQAISQTIPLEHSNKETEADT